MKPCMPSMNDSSEPVESKITRTPGGGSSRKARTSATLTATALRLSLAPGTTARAPMSIIEAPASAEKNAPMRRKERRPVSPQRATNTGPRNTPKMIGTLCSAFSWSLGMSFIARRGSPGWNTSPECAASWWEMKTTVRSASGSPASAITLYVERFGSRWRRNHSRPPLTSS